MNNPDKADKDLERRVRELVNKLLEVNIKAEGYEIMIEIAEKELNIPIKKSQTPSNLKLKGKAYKSCTGRTMSIIWDYQTSLSSTLLVHERAVFRT